ncbi:MAG: hypothetical protein R2824_07305 [Saprospiraceae bacterium]|nr:hypothetical protein [Lewinella sp.]
MADEPSNTNARTIPRQFAVTNSIFEIDLRNYLSNFSVQNIEYIRSGKNMTDLNKSWVFKWVPDEKDLGGHEFKFNVTETTGETRLFILPVEVKSPGIQVKWDLPVQNSFTVEKEGEISIPNPNPATCEVKISRAPTGARFENGIFSWTPKAEDVGEGRLQFSLNLLDQDKTLIVRDISYKVAAGKPKGVFTGDLRSFAAAFMWTYNLMALGALAFILVLSKEIDLITGFILLILLELIYLLIAANNKRFQKSLNMTDK